MLVRSLALSARRSFLGGQPSSLLRASSLLLPFSPIRSRMIAAPGAAEGRGSAVAAEFSSEAGVKRKMPKVIGTHHGTFHCDEALGCFMIRLTEKFKDADIVRTRDQKVLDTLDAVLDVGGVYEPEKDRYDHHQKGFDGVFGNGFVTKLSSAGLVYKHYGQEIVAKELGLPLDHPSVQLVYLAVYRSFMEAIDGIDNGVNQYESDKPPRYSVGTDLSARVGKLNPDWMEPSTEELEMTRFQQAMQLAGSEFLHSVRWFAKSWLPARDIVASCLDDAKQVDESGEIMVLKSYCPWKQHLAELEEERKGTQPLIKYVVYQDERGNSWRVQAVSVAPGSFESRKPLPTPWRGLRDDELSTVSGIPGGVFVHMSGFIGGNKTYEGAVSMAKTGLVLD